MRSQDCDIATAASEGETIVLNFGATHDGGGDHLAVRLLRRIALRPLTAKHLQDVLRKLIAEADAAANGKG